MLKVYQRLPDTEQTPIDDVVVLSHEQREKARVLAQTQSGKEVGIFLERGRPMQVGELLQSMCGKVIRVEAAQEPVTTATTEDWGLFSRACYHLGNRHVKIQIQDRKLRITPDHVLEDMLKGLGLSISQEVVAFEPESGAYSHHSHGHGHQHSHDHTDEHAPNHTAEKAHHQPELDHEPTA